MIHVSQWIQLILICALSIVSCGKVGQPSPGTSGVQETANQLERVNRSNVTLDGYPHEIDFIYPENSNNETIVIVLLHGGGGTKADFSYFLGFKNDSQTPYDFENQNYLIDYLNERNVAFVFPQGQSIPEKPAAVTWNNTVMTSGQNDKAFLISLSSYLRKEEGFSKVFLMGHSMGGVMVNRMWCEAAEHFDAFGSSAGPMSPTLFNSCSPSSYKPYIHVTGLNDRILQITEERFNGDLIDHSGDEFLELDQVTRRLGGPAFVHPEPEFRNEITSYPARVNWVCGEPASGYAYFPNSVTWSAKERVNCGGKIKMVELKGRDHCTGGAESVGGYKCDVPLTTLGTTDHLNRFVDFFIGYRD